MYVLNSPGWSKDVVELCKKYKDEGVVAIDLAGDESLNCEANPEHMEAYEVSLLKHQYDEHHPSEGTLNCLCFTTMQYNPASPPSAVTIKYYVIFEVIKIPLQL